MVITIWIEVNMKPDNIQLKTEIKSRIERLIQEQSKVVKLKDPLLMDKEITKILNEKNKLTIQLMSLK